MAKRSIDIQAEDEQFAWAQKSQSRDFVRGQQQLVSGREDGMRRVNELGRVNMANGMKLGNPFGGGGSGGRTARPLTYTPSADKDNPFNPANWGKEEDKNKPVEGNYEAPRAQKGIASFDKPGLDTGSQPALSSDALNLAAPGEYVKAALAKDPSQRSLQEKEAIKQRQRAEEINFKMGNKVTDSITPTVITEQEAGRHGANEGRAIVIASAARAKEMARGGLNQDMSPMTDAQKAASAPKATTGFPAPTPLVAPAPVVRDGHVIPGAPGSPGKPLGFASRVMPDNTIKTASGLNAAGSSNIRSFSTQDAAMAFYRPAPQVAAPPIDPSARPAHAVMPVAQAAPRAAPAPATNWRDQATAMTGNPFNGPANPSPLAAAKTTSPTAKIEQTASKMGNPAAPVAATPAWDARPAPVSSTVSTWDSKPSPAGPTVSTAWDAQKTPMGPTVQTTPVSGPFRGDPTGVNTPELVGQALGGKNSSGAPDIGFARAGLEVLDRSLLTPLADAWKNRPNKSDGSLNGGNREAGTPRATGTQDNPFGPARKKSSASAPSKAR